MAHHVARYRAGVHPRYRRILIPGLLTVLLIVVIVAAVVSR